MNDENEPATALVFTSMTCPHCPVAKKALERVGNERSDVETHILDTRSSQGRRLAKKFGIQSVPTFIFYGPGHEAPMGLIGTQSDETINKYIDVALGKRSLKDEKKKFSLKNLFKKNT